jgi:hypothetical protein
MSITLRRVRSFIAVADQGGFAKPQKSFRSHSRR